MKDINQIISEFSPISLSEMDDVKLMSRTDTKFAFNTSKLPDLLLKLSEHYKVLEIDKERIHDYKSLYFDTDDRKFFLDHHNGRVNRNKIRFREYVGSGLTFLEIKLKNNKGKTIKKRIKVKEITEKLSEKQMNFVKEKVGDDIDVNSKQWINFSRITFVHKTMKERLTMDVNLTFENKENKGDLKDIVIAEVKQERMSRSSDFMKIAKEMSVLPIRLSKYCISTLSLNPELKHNKFKEKLLFINKLKLQ
ncbi:MAG: polyphosphate polymerase domain-containing protein [Flavobacteriales bacterium]|nr:polyphosphate polymerase domain-containing protein [Flavobacteriales bacterium]